MLFTTSRKCLKKQGHHAAKSLRDGAKIDLSKLEPKMGEQTESDAAKKEAQMDAFKIKSTTGTKQHKEREKVFDSNIARVHLLFCQDHCTKAMKA